MIYDKKCPTPFLMPPALPKKPKLMVKAEIVTNSKQLLTCICNLILLVVCFYFGVFKC